MDEIIALLGDKLCTIGISVITAAITSVVVSFLANRFYFFSHKNEHRYNFQRDGLPTITVHQDIDLKTIKEGCTFKDKLKSGILKKYNKHEEIEGSYFYKMESVHLNQKEVLRVNSEDEKFQILSINNNTDKLFEMNRIIIEQKNNKKLVFEFDDSDYSILYGKSSFLLLVPSYFPLIPRVELCFDKYLITYYSTKEKKDNLLKPKIKKGKV